MLLKANGDRGEEWCGRVELKKVLNDVATFWSGVVKLRCG
jgi:hypothetical protein